MPLVLAGATSGSTTLQATDAVTQTITLPNNTGTIITTASSGQSIPSAALPAGSVIQVVNASTTTQVSNSTTTFADTNLTATITPKFATSKVLVIVNQAVWKSAGSVSNAPDIKLIRNSTDLGKIAFAVLFNNTAMEVYGSCSASYLDSPTTTSATTYKTQLANQLNAASVKCQPDNTGPSYITLMEIAA